jgi:septal ring factor EnvC (AmiA/AmiB activator)|tara:strand:+ start:194 stop:472 length:279 start_codon:yes stop_codon:yes gene_type:complete
MNWDKAKDVVTLALIPALGWVMLTMRDIGDLQARYEQQQAKIMTLQAEVKAVNKRTQAMEVQSAKIETKLEALGQQLTRIERMLAVYEDARD